MNQTDIILSQIMLASIEGRATTRKLTETRFDCRNDVVASPQTSAIAVSITLFNEKWLSPGNDRRIRRKLILTLTNAESDARISSKTVTVNIPGSLMFTEVCAHLPFKAISLPLDHDYNLIVTDAATGVQLGHREFHVFPNRYDGRKIEDAFSAEEAGITTIYGSRLFSSLSPRPNDYASVRFNLMYEFNDRLDKMPDVEIRLYFPDGSLISRFHTVICDNPDVDRYHVEAPFLVTDDKRGIVYAEALIDDVAFAGVVFRTEGPELKGGQSGKHLHILDDYSLRAATNRFLEQDTHEDEFTEENFDRLLDEFIKSEKEATSAGNDTEGNGRNSDKDSHEAPDSLSNELQQLVGLTEVKQKLITYGKMMKFNAMRSEAGLPVVSAPLHSMFLGSPGTGKTTVAKMIGKMLHDVGLLSKGHVVVRERATLSGTHYGDHEDLTLKALEEAKGGILFIDEAYQLFQQNDSKDPGRLVLETLLTALADENNRDWMLILAGYRDEMLRLFDMNPGLRSRIPEANIYTFDDFSESELMEIADRWFKKNKYNLTADARAALVNRLSSDHAARDRSFGNARHVVNLIQTSILPSMASRIMDKELPSQESLTDILPSDIPAPSAPMQPTRRRIGFNL